MDSTPFPFPSLGQIVRFQTMRNLEGNAIRKITRTLFAGSKLQFLENLVYPEMSNKLHNIVKRTKMSTQLHLAEKELLHRTDKEKDPKAVCILTSFSAMSLGQLVAWIFETKKSLNTPRKPSLIRVGGDSHHSIALPSASTFKFSCVKYDDRDAQLTCNRMDRSKNLARHPINMASFAALGLSLPIAIENNTLLAQTPLHSSDNVRSTVALTPVISDTLFFLSYGTYRLSAHPKPPSIAIDCETQTCNSVAHRQSQTQSEVQTEDKV